MSVLFSQIIHFLNTFLGLTSAAEMVEMFVSFRSITCTKLLKSHNATSFFEKYSNAKY